MPQSKKAPSKTIPGVVRAFWLAAHNTMVHDGIEHAGYLAFLGLLALFPFLVFVVALAGFLGEGEAGSHFINLVFSELPQHMINALKPRVDEIISGPPQGLLTVSILGAIWTSSSAVEGYRTVLNRAYHVEAPPAYIWRRLLSIAQILLFSFAVVIAMIIIVLLPILWGKTQAFFGGMGMEVPSSFAIALISISVLFLVISAAFYLLPNIRQSFSSVAPGALLVTLLWFCAARVLSLYFSQFQQVNLIYGSIGGIIATLIFFYISNVIFIYGAEFNYLLTRLDGKKPKEKRPARKDINDL